MNTFKSPIIYDPDFMKNNGYDADAAFEYYMSLNWDERTPARKEIFFATTKIEYTYGTGDFARTYWPRDMDTNVRVLGNLIAEKFGCEPLELCFMNRYDNARNALGWHADDAESIDHSRPIPIISLGSERELWTKPIGGDNSTVEKFMLGHGSLLLMKAGMQQSHLHRIPKVGRVVGPRISLTYRGLFTN